MVVTLSNDVRWIEECVDLGSAAAPRRHKHVSVYLVPADRPVLVDAGSFLHREAILDDVRAVVDDDGVGTVILSHSDYPHAANVREFVGPDGAELVASSGAPDKQGLPEARKCEIGGSMTIQGDRFSFIDPPLADRSHTTWVFHHGSGTLFTADGFGSRHRPGDCTETAASVDDGVATAAIHAYHEANLPWLPYVDPGLLAAALWDILDAYPIRWVAPIHGHPIPDTHLDEYVDGLVEAADRIATAATPDARIDP